MKNLLRGIDSISEWSGKIISVFILIIMVTLLIEITLRYVFNAPTIWAHKTSSQFFGAYSVLAGAYVLLRFQHVKVDIIYQLFSPRKRAAIDSVTSLFFFFFIGLMLVHGWQSALHSIRVGETGIPPWPVLIYPLRCTIPIAALFILLQGLAYWIRSLNLAIMGRELQ